MMPAKIEYIGDHRMPLLVRPSEKAVDPMAWISDNREFLKAKLLESGGLLLRDFNFEGIERFEQFMRAAFGDLLEYKERSSPRNRVKGNIYTSTEYPADQHIFLHNENSYQQTFPLKIGFFCAIPATAGGETPVADVRNVYKKIPRDIREKFEEKKVMYVRNFGDCLGLSWQTVFQTQEKIEVESYCRDAGIVVEWKENGDLRTRQIRPAVAKHPVTGDLSWFNHATFFHVSTLPQLIREMLLSDFAEEDLPSNTYYGDGSVIEGSVLEELRRIYSEETVQFKWQLGDLLLLDNMLVAHGRAPFEGNRRIVVGMAEPYSLDRA